MPSLSFIALCLAQVLCVFASFSPPTFQLSLNIGSGVGQTGGGGLTGVSQMSLKWYNLESVWFKSVSQIFMADQWDGVVYQVTGGFGYFYAGYTGIRTSSGNGGQATSARLDSPIGTWGDTNVAMYIADYQSNNVRYISTTGIISSFIGIYGTATSAGDGGRPSSATMKGAIGVWGDTSNLYIYVADYTAGNVRRVDLTANTISTLTEFSVTKPYSVWGDTLNNLYVSDVNSGTRYVYKRTSVGIVSTFAGTGGNWVSKASSDQLAATSSPCDAVYGLWGDTVGNIYFSTGSPGVRLVDATTGIITTVAGSGTSAANQVGAATSSPIGTAYGMWGDSLTGDLYVNDNQNHYVLKLAYSAAPTAPPTLTPTVLPTTRSPTIIPTVFPTTPTMVPSTIAPTLIPTVIPTTVPTTVAPSIAPTAAPSIAPTLVPTQSPSIAPSVSPTVVPTSTSPTASPTVQSLVALPTFDKASLLVNTNTTRTATDFTVKLRVIRDISYKEILVVILPRFSTRLTEPSTSSNISYGSVVISPSYYFTAAWVEGALHYDEYNTPYLSSMLLIKTTHDMDILAESNLEFTVYKENGIGVMCGFPSSDEMEGKGKTIQEFPHFVAASIRPWNEKYQHLESVLNYTYDPTTANLISVESIWKNFTLTANHTNLLNDSFVIDTHSGVGKGCPSNCNFHGVCDYCLESCKCYDGWGSDTDVIARGGYISPYCSDLVCPSGVAIGDVAIAADKVHAEAECSNAGLCDRATGKCKCFPPFTGSACDKLSCFNDCSGHGRCLTMAEIARTAQLEDDFDFTIEYGSGASLSTTTWDHNSMRGCVCDSSWDVGFATGQVQLAEYFGADCSLKRCPSGDDPFTSVDEENCHRLNQIGSGPERGRVGNKCHVDCSNRGICDYNAGVCSCFEGSWGDACQYIGNAGSYSEN